MITNDMKHRIKFNMKVKKQSATGDLITEYQEVGSCWAAILKTTFKEFKDKTANHEANMTKASDTKVFKIRYLQDFEVRKELVIEFVGTKNNKKYEVIGIEPDETSFDYLLVSAKVVE